MLLLAFVNHGDSGLSNLATVVEWAAVFDLITDCFLCFPISSVPLKQTVRYSFPYILRAVLV